MIISCLFNIPFTGVGKSSVAQVQSVLNKAPKGIPIPALHAIDTNDTLSIEEKGLVGDWSLYNKQIGVREEVPYPITLKNMKEYFEKNSWGTALNFLNQPFIFIDPGNGKTNISISEFTGNKIKIAANADAPAQLILQQNFYPHWYYENGAVKKEVDHAGINFMSAPVVTGENNITFSFEPVLVKWMMLLSLISFLVAVISIIALKPTPFSLS